MQCDTEEQFVDHTWLGKSEAHLHVVQTYGKESLPIVFSYEKGVYTSCKNPVVGLASHAILHRSLQLATPTRAA